MTERTEKAIHVIYELYEDEHLSPAEFSQQANQYFKENGFGFRESWDIMDKVKAMHQAK